MQIPPRPHGVGASSSARAWCSSRPSLATPSAIAALSAILEEPGALHIVRVIERTEEYWVLERTGTFDETEALLEQAMNRQRP